MSNSLNITLWIVQGICCLIFLYSGGSKVLGAESAVHMFEAIGVGQWYRYLTGAIELIAATLLVTPSLPGFAAILLLCVMGGAIIIHTFILHDSPLVPIILIAPLLFILWGRGYHPGF